MVWRWENKCLSLADPAPGAPPWFLYAANAIFSNFYRELIHFKQLYFKRQHVQWIFILKAPCTPPPACPEIRRCCLAHGVETAPGKMFLFSFFYRFKFHLLKFSFDIFYVKTVLAIKSNPQSTGEETTNPLFPSEKQNPTRSYELILSTGYCKRHWNKLLNEIKMPQLYLHLQVD